MLSPNRAAVALLCALIVISSTNAATQKNPKNVRLEWLDLSRFEPRGGGETRRCKTGDGHPLKLAGKEFPNGIATYSDSEIVFDLFDAATHFSALLGIDDQAGDGGSVHCRILADGKQVGNDVDLKRGDQPKEITADLTGAKRMTLILADAGPGNRQVDIINGLITVKDPDAAVRPEVAQRFADPDALKVPPIASGDPPEPAIHGPRVVGTTPGRPCAFLIPAAGAGTLTYTAENLPDGLSVDPKSGIISGSLKSEGTYQATLLVSSELGKAHRTLTNVAGQHKLAQTPPMGWNSWNAFGFNVNAEKVRAAADAMVKSGLAAKGYQLRRHRRRLAGDAWSRWNDSGERAVWRHQGAGRLRSQQGLALRHLFLARPENLRQLRRQLQTRARRRQLVRHVRRGLSQIRLLLLRHNCRRRQQSRNGAAALSRDA